MRKALVVVALSLMACGPVGGDSCSRLDTWACLGRDTVLICEDGPRGRTFFEYPCAGGCETRVNGAVVVCNFTGSKEGDPCPKPGFGYCANSSSFIGCVSGVWKAQPCSSCTTSTNQDGFPVGSCAP